jgi:hypothetical protein
MDITPPATSRIRLDSLSADPVLRIPHASGGPMRFATALFLVGWLIGWAFGFRFALEQVLQGEGGLFLIGWLIAWTAGGAWAAYMAYRMLRPSVDARLTLEMHGVAYDSGVAPLVMDFRNATQKEFWKNMRAKRRHLYLDRSILQTLALRETDGGNRLTVDYESERVDIAEGVSEVEREWLYTVLVDRYGLDTSRSSN